MEVGGSNAATLSITIGQFLSICGVLITVSITLFGIIIKAINKIGDLENRMVKYETETNAMKREQDQISRKLEEILEALSDLNKSVATLNERTSRHRP